MRISTLDISRITTTVRRHEALLRYARYLFIFNLAIFLWEVAILQLSQTIPFRGAFESIATPDWKWSALVLTAPGSDRTGAGGPDVVVADQPYRQRYGRLSAR